jgi:hypothetical protein
MGSDVVICIVDDQGNLHKLRNSDAFIDKEILKDARKLMEQYIKYKEIMGDYEKHIAELKVKAEAIGLELEP